MDASSEHLLLQLMRSQRTGALGTLRDGSPLVSLIAWVPVPDFSAFIILASGLAQHTQDILNDPRVSLMIAEGDDGKRNPQTLARISLQGEAARIPPGPAADEARELYLRKFPESEQLFGLGDFALFRISIRTARFVAGFGKTFNLTAGDFTRISSR